MPRGSGTGETTDVADDKSKDKDGEAKADVVKKKGKGLSAVVLVATGAVLGGAGVTFALPPKRVEVKVPAQAHELVDVQHPDLMEFQFNPRTQSGRAFASVGFYFVYRVRDDRENEAFESIRANWDRAVSNALQLLGARTLTELAAENGKRVLGKDLADELDASLFPGKKNEKVAQVTEVLWRRWILQ
jgi:flagellar basal body-associated protein FliL